MNDIEQLKQAKEKCLSDLAEWHMIAKFHYMGDDAWKPDSKHDSFELVGVNNSVDMLEYDHTRLAMAAYVCHLTGFEQIDKAIGGVYEMTMTRKV